MREKHSSQYLVINSLEATYTYELNKHFVHVKVNRFSGIDESDRLNPQCIAAIHYNLLNDCSGSEAVVEMLTNE